jgi:diguanylate cyclase (GGDEF)-like protein
MQKVYCVENKMVDEILDRHKYGGGQPPIHFSEIIREVLEFVNRFIAPSRAGTIYIDDPSTRVYDENGNLDYGATKLVFAACFGDKSESLIGRTIAANKGIVGYVYRTGQALLVNDTVNNPFFDPEVSAELGVASDNMLTVPLTVGTTTLGVLQLINKKEKGSYSKYDLELVDYFCKRHIVTNIVRAIEFNKDYLTGLYNQRSFESRLGDKLEYLRAKNKKGYLYFIDLDFFKTVPDTFGHSTGSKAIVLVADFLGKYIFDRYERKGLTARYGGDEYEVFIPEIKQSEAIELAREIGSGIGQLKMTAINSNGESVDALECVTASIGVASTSNKFTSVDEYIKLADQAMYLAKTRKNSICLLHNDKYVII